METVTVVVPLPESLKSPHGIVCPLGRNNATRASFSPLPFFIRVVVFLVHLPGVGDFFSLKKNIEA